MTVPVRYILAAIAFGVAALGFALLPAHADCGSCQPTPPPCHTCNPSPPPCHSCQPPRVIIPPPNVTPPNIVVVNAGARASAQASATAIAIANANTGDVIVHNNMVVDASASAQTSVQSSGFTVTDAAVETQTAARDRDLLIQAICLDATNNPHPASQVFGGQTVAANYTGELYRCMSGTRMRYTVDNRNVDCTAGQALWYEGAQVRCQAQIERRPCNERSLLRRFGPGDKLVHIRDTETRSARTETTFNGAMSMDGGVGAGSW